MKEKAWSKPVPFSLPGFFYVPPYCTLALHWPICTIAFKVILFKLDLVTPLHTSAFQHCSSNTAFCLFLRCAMQILSQGLCTCYHFMEQSFTDTYMAYSLISFRFLSQMYL